MQIAVHSASSAVTRTLERIIAESGHRLASSADTADLVLIDQLHPLAEAPQAGTVLNLVSGTAADEHSIACPLRPERLVQRLTLYSTTQHIPLSHGWVLDLLARTLQHESGITASLTEKECSLLNHLAQAEPDSVARDELLEQVWGMSANVDTHTLETHIYRLRAKLSGLTPPPCDILTVEGAYRLVFAAENG